MQVNWLYVGLAAFVVYGSIFGYFVAKREWTRAGLGVGLANMLFVVLNLAAPFLKFINLVLKQLCIICHVDIVHNVNYIRK